MRLEPLAHRGHVVGVGEIEPREPVEAVARGYLLGGGGAGDHVGGHLDPGARYLAQVDLDDPGGMREHHLDLAVRTRAPVPALGAERRPELSFFVQPPGPAGVDQERLAVMAEADLLPEPERLDGRVPADPGAFPPPEQEAQRLKVRMYRHGVLRPRTPARPRTGTPRRS